MPIAFGNSQRHPSGGIAFGNSQLHTAIVGGVATLESGVIQVGEEFELGTPEDLVTITQASINGEPLDILASAARLHRLRVPADIDERYDLPNAAVQVGDGSVIATLSGVTLLAPNDITPVDYLGPAPDPLTAETLAELVENDLSFVLLDGDQMAFRTIPGVTLRPNSSFLYSDVFISEYQIFRTSEARWTPTQPFAVLPIPNPLAFNFDGPDGSRLISSFTVHGQFRVLNNQIVIDGGIPPGFIGALFYLDAGTPDGVLMATYNANGGDGGESGLLLRGVDSGNFIDFVNLDGTLQLVIVVDGSPGDVIGTYVIPNYSNTADYRVIMRVRGASIVVFVDGIEVINITETRLQSGQLFGGKFAGTFGMNDLVIPNGFFYRDDKVIDFVPGVGVEDAEPDAFVFVPARNALRGAVVISNAVTIEGTTVDAAITIVGGEYSIDGVNWISAPGVLRPRSNLIVRGTASAYYYDGAGAGDVDVTVTVGGVNAVFNIRTVEDPATASPVITIPGPNPATVNQGDVFTLPAATASDLVDGDLSSAIQITGAIDTSQLGLQSVTYSVMDSDGNLSSVVYEVLVVAVNADTTAPVITLVGGLAIDWVFGQPFVDPGFSALDDTDGVVPVTVSGVVDVNTAGTQTLTYSAVDAAGNVATLDRTVNVLALPASIVATAVIEPAQSLGMSDVLLSGNTNTMVVSGFMDAVTGQSISAVDLVMRVSESSGPAIGGDISPQYLGDLVAFTFPVVYAFEVVNVEIIGTAANGSRLRWFSAIPVMDRAI